MKILNGVSGQNYGGATKTIYVNGTTFDLGFLLLFEFTGFWDLIYENVFQKVYVI